ncbi:MAG: VIT1/CCC1 transporter family protein [Acidilobus sp.]
MSLSGGDLRQVERFCEDELSTYLLYKELARAEGSPLSIELMRSAEQERGHYEFWRGLLGRDCRAARPPRFFRLLYRVFGPVFTLQLLERREENAVKAYEAFRPKVPPGLRQRLEEIIADERSHESEFLRGLSDVRVKYLGFVALGIADAITELIGVYAGFLGATLRTFVVGLAGLLVGFSAAISMAAAAFIQARQEGHVSPGGSAAATGVSYFITAIVLALPYFITGSTVIAMVSSVALGVAALSVFHLYSSVVQGTSFRREVGIALGLLMAAALAGLAFGWVIGSAFHVRAQLP